MTGARVLRILVVEDEPVNRALLRAVIGAATRLGSPEVDEADTLAAARTIVRDRHPDVLILDVRLPDGNGLELARELPPQGTAGRPHVVVMSASVLPPDREAALASGGDAFVGKPFLPRELIAVLEGLLDGDGAAAPEATGPGPSWRRGR